MYYAAAFLIDWQQAGSERHWLMRAKPNLRYEVITTFAPGDCWVRLPVSPQARAQRPDLPATWEARLIECRVGGQLQRYLTSLPDPRQYPAREVVAHYVQRWEIELGFREIKQGM
ncbi:MAG: transposase, partial [Burkholderiaceae bacterium]